MARDKCNPITLYEAIVDRLVTQLDVDESVVLFSLDPRKKKRSPADLTYVVSPLNGSFDEGMIEGGGQEQATVETGFTVTIRSYRMLDEAQVDDALLNDPSLGIMQAATQVLRALTVYDPEDADGNPLLRDLIHPTGFEFEKQSQTDMSMTIGFKITFDWDLS